MMLPRQKHYTSKELRLIEDFCSLVQTSTILINKQISGHCDCDLKNTEIKSARKWSSVAQLVEAWLSISVVVDGLGSIPRGTHFFLALFISVFFKSV